MKMITISNNEIEEIKAKAKKNKNKHIDKKLQVLIMRYEGNKIFFVFLLWRLLRI